jgi:LDH2 family malate/lactate/ureidoglycolate dehydrogenase
MSKPEKIRIAADALRAMVREMFEKLGASDQDARVIADVLLWANLRGVDSHGISRIPRYVEMFESGEAKARPDIKVAHPRPAVITIDADSAPGPVAMHRATLEARAVAGKTGVAWAAVRGTVHTGAIGYYVTQIAEAGMIGIGLVAGVPNMAYAGSKSAAVATSPIAIAVPSQEHGTVVLDMATAVIALGKIAQYRQSGKPLAPGMALTEAGEPTTDAATAEIPLPMGGAKGSGLSLMIEFLSGVLVGNPIVAEFHTGTPHGQRHRQNGTIIAVDISAFGALSSFQAGIDSAIDAVKALPREAGVDEILYPGERGSRAFAERSRGGIPVAPGPWQKLCKDAQKLGVRVPEAVPAA